MGPSFFHPFVVGWRAWGAIIMIIESDHEFELSNLGLACPRGQRLMVISMSVKYQIINFFYKKKNQDYNTSNDGLNC